MDRVVVTTEIERDIEILPTWHEPVLVLGIINCTLNAAIDGIRYISRYLRKSVAGTN
jgi:hypothetical protein